MTKNNDGRLDHSDPIPDFIKSGIYRVFNFIFLFCSSAQEQYLRQALMPQIRYCLLMQRRRV